MGNTVDRLYYHCAKTHADALHPRFGDLVHVFVSGFMVYDGTEFICDWEFKKMFPTLNYDELNAHKNMWRRL